LPYPQGPPVFIGAIIALATNRMGSPPPGRVPSSATRTHRCPRPRVSSTRAWGRRCARRRSSRWRGCRGTCDRRSNGLLFAHQWRGRCRGSSWQPSAPHGRHVWRRWRTGGGRIATAPDWTRSRLACAARTPLGTRRARDARHRAGRDGCNIHHQQRHSVASGHTRRSF